MYSLGPSQGGAIVGGEGIEVGVGLEGSRGCWVGFILGVEVCIGNRLTEIA